MEGRSSSDLGPERFVRIRTVAMLEGLDIEESEVDRQQLVPGFDQDAARNACVSFCGAGGLFAEQGPDLVRKGYGCVVCADHDCFSPSNFPRQFCYRKDLYRNKALAVAENIAGESLLSSEIVGLGMPYRDARQYADWDRCTLGVCDVDNNETRVDFSRDFRRMRKPAIFCAVSNDANSGYVFVQDGSDDAPCFGCAFPDKVDDKVHPCPRTPACRDILKAVGAFVVYAIDSLVMGRKRNWNLRYVFLAGFLEDATLTVKKNLDCPLCGGG